MSATQPPAHSSYQIRSGCPCDYALLSSQSPLQGRPIEPLERLGDVRGTRLPFLTALKPYVQEQIFQRAGASPATDGKSVVGTLMRSLYAGLTGGKLLERASVCSSGVSYLNKERPCIVIVPLKDQEDRDVRKENKIHVCLMGSFEGSWKLPAVFTKTLPSVMIPVYTPSLDFMPVSTMERHHIHTIPAWKREPQWLMALSVSAPMEEFTPFRNHSLEIPRENCPFVDDEVVSDLITLCNDNSYTIGEIYADSVARVELADDLLSQTKIANLFKDELKAEGLAYPQQTSAANASMRASRKSRRSRRSRLSHTASAPMPFHLPSASITSRRGSQRFTPGNIHTSAADLASNWRSGSLED